jgi:hypothetical protein
MEKMIADPSNSHKNVKNPGPGAGANSGPGSNPFTEAFKDMSNSFNVPGGNDPLMNMFKDGNFGEDMKNLDKDGFLKNLYGVLGELSNSSEKGPESTTEKDSSKMSQKELYPLFESLFYILMKEDMSTPLNQIKTSVNEYLKTNFSKITEEEKEKYKCVNTYIDTVLVEVKRAEPDKKLIIETFQKLHELSDFGADIFPDGGMMGSLGGGLLGAGAGSDKSNVDLKNIADNFFKK